jgi:hypothetical protein
MAGRARHTTVSAFYMPLILCALRRSGVTAIDHELGGWGSETYWISRIPRFIGFVDALRAASHRLSSQAANFYSTLGTFLCALPTTRTDSLIIHLCAFVVCVLDQISHRAIRTVLQRCKNNSSISCIMSMLLSRSPSMRPSSDSSLSGKRIAGNEVWHE